MAVETASTWSNTWSDIMEIGENLWEKQFAEAVTRGVPQFKNKNFANFTERDLCWSLFLIKLQAFRPAILLKRLQLRCFLVNYTKFLRTPISRNDTTASEFGLLRGISYLQKCHLLGKSVSFSLCVYMTNQAGPLAEISPFKDEILVSRMIKWYI